jgi:hypothetical protein
MSIAHANLEQAFNLIVEAAKARLPITEEERRAYQRCTGWLLQLDQLMHNRDVLSQLRVIHNKGVRPLAANQVKP